jgi:hypothetical protein
MLIDLVAVFALSVGWLKRTLQRRPSTPYFIRDLMTHTILRKRNRRVPPCRTPLPR